MSGCSGVIRGREVRVDGSQLEMRTVQQLGHAAREVVVTEPKPVHARVDLEVIAHAPALPRGLGLDGPRRRRRRDRRREIELEEAGEIADAQRAEDQDLGADAAPAEHDGLLDVGAREHRRAGALEGPGHRHGAVSVGIGLDDGDDARRAAHRRGAGGEKRVMLR